MKYEIKETKGDNRFPAVYRSPDRLTEVMRISEGVWIYLKSEDRTPGSYLADYTKNEVLNNWPRVHGSITFEV